MFTKDKTNVCKGVGILLLLFHHMFTKRWLLNDLYLISNDPDTVELFAKGMRVCVWLFAFLSAYGLTLKYSKLSKDKRTWFIPRQWLSLMKPFWLIFPIELLLKFIIENNVHLIYQNNFWYFLYDFFAVADILKTPKLMGVFWYMSFALLVVLFIPLINKFCSFCGYASLPITFIAIQLMRDGIVTFNGGSYLDYLFVVVCGVLIAQKDIFNRIAAIKLHILWRIVISVLLAAAVYGALWFRLTYLSKDPLHLGGVFSGAAAVMICLLFGVFITFKPLCFVLGFLGRYSGLMFLLHVIFISMLPDVVCITPIASVDFLILLAESLEAAILIDLFRRLIRYDKWFEKLIGLCKRRA